MRTDIRRRGVLFPALLIAAGGAAVLVNAGLATTGGWERLAQVWPLLLVVIGFDLVAVAASAPIRAIAVGAMLGIIVLAGTYVVAGPAPATLNTVTGTLKGPESSPGSAALKIALDGGKVQLLTGPTGGLLYTADYDYPGASVDQSAVRWHIEVDAAGVDTNANLGEAAAITSFKASVAGGNFDLSLPPPSGESTVKISGVGTSATVRVPTGSAMQAHVSGVGANFTGPAGSAGLAMGERTWSTEGFAGSTDHYLIDASGVGANLHLEEI